MGQPIHALGRVGLRALAGIALLFSLGALLAGPALATPSWLAPSELSATGGDAFHPQVAVDQAGDAVGVWERSDGTYRIIEASTRAAGGGWLPPQELSAGGQNAFSPQVAVDSAGDAVAVWDRSNGSNYIVEAATRLAGADWQAPVELSATGQDGLVPQIALDPAGDAVAVWDVRQGSNFVIEAATKAVGDAWGVGQEISAPGKNAEEPQARVAIDPAGDAVAVWERYDGANYIVEAATKAPAAPWLPAQELSAAGQSAFGADVAVDPVGDVVAVWERDNGTNQIIETATRAPGAPWLPAEALSVPGQNAFGAHVAVDQMGNAVAVWIRYNGANYIVEAAGKESAGPWLPAEELSPAGQSAFSVQLALSPTGDAVAVWTRSDGTNQIVEAANKLPGGAWALPARGLSAVGQNAESPQVAVDPAGDAVATWDRSDGTNTIVQAVGYDAAGPQLRSLSIPAGGTAGQSLPVSVSPFDVWSALGGISWSFGDGGSAGGARAAHTYAKPGTYEVTVSAADVLGNTTSAVGTVAITAAAPLAPSRPTAKGTAFAAKIARVKGGKALLKLHCKGGVSCQGVVELRVARKAKTRGHRRPATLRRIGRAEFRIPVAKTKTVAVNLSAKGAASVREAGKAGLKAQLGGSDVKSRTVTLKPAPHHRRGAARPPAIPRPPW
jgi:hypothetical protein